MVNIESEKVFSPALFHAAILMTAVSVVYVWFSSLREGGGTLMLVGKNRKGQELPLPDLEYKFLFLPPPDDSNPAGVEQYLQGVFHEAGMTLVRDHGRGFGPANFHWKIVDMEVAKS